jgi:hypothetical protein
MTSAAIKASRLKAGQNNHPFRFDDVTERVAGVMGSPVQQGLTIMESPE